MSEVGVSSFREYLSLARSDAAENVSLLNAVLINVTEFFCDPPAWQRCAMTPVDSLPA